MNDLTLESLAERLAALERKVAALASGVIPPSRDWRDAVGMFGDSEFMRAVDDECLRAREAEREAARRDEGEEAA